MIDIRLDDTTQVLLYKQIVEQVRQSIAVKQLQAGEHLPTVRQLAKDLHVNPGTVVRAYLELEKEGLVVSRRGGGTLVSAGADNPMLLELRKKRLSDMIGSDILEALTLGYSPTEIETLFHMHLDRWREEQRQRTDISEHQKLLKDRDIKAASRDTIVIIGSHDLAFDILLSKLKYRNPEINIDVTYAGSLGGLIALQEERADLAGIHLLDEESGEYNYPYVKRILSGRELAIVHLAYRVQGLMFASGNPKRVKGIEDLKRSDITFINRQKGSGTRLLLDLELKRHGIQQYEVKGYKREMDTHLAVAVSIARGEADVGLGIEVAAHALELGFLPVLKERYDLVIPMENYTSKLFGPLLGIIRSDDFKKIADNVGGYDTSQTGTTTFCR